MALSQNAHILRQRLACFYILEPDRVFTTVQPAFSMAEAVRVYMMSLPTSHRTMLSFRAIMALLAPTQTHLRQSMLASKSAATADGSAPSSVVTITRE